MKKINFGAIGSALGNGLRMVGGGIAKGWVFVTKFWTTIRTWLVKLWPFVNALFIWLWILENLANNLVYGTFLGQLFNNPADITVPAKWITAGVMVVLAFCSMKPKTDELRLLIQEAIIWVCGVLNALLSNPMWFSLVILTISVFAEGIFMDKYGKRAPSRKDQLVLYGPDGKPMYTLEKGKV